MSEKEKDLITVIVPVYDVEKYLKKCVDSILAQTYKNLEIILVDDGSPDQCPKICDEYAEKDSRIRVIHKNNGGLSDARNVGLDNAKGEFIGFVDSDDWIAKDMFEYLYKGINKYGTDIACCEAVNVFKYRMEYKNLDVDRIYTTEETLDELFWDRTENYAWNKLYRADLWDHVRFPVGKNFEDILTIYKIVEKSERVAFLKEGKYYYRRREDSISGKRDFSNRKHIYEAIIERYEDVTPRMPQYKEPLFDRIRTYYISELSYEIVNKPERQKENMELLSILSPFVEKHKDEMGDILEMEKLERLKLTYFSKGTIEGCKKSLKYHNLIKRETRIKNNIKRIFHLDK